jgi:hypothetical protein
MRGDRRLETMGMPTSVSWWSRLRHRGNARRVRALTSARSQLAVAAVAALAFTVAACGPRDISYDDGVYRSTVPPSFSASPSPHPRVRGLQAVHWGWSDERQPDPSGTTLHVGVYFMQCASGRAPKNPEPVIRSTDRYVHIGVWAEPLPPGAHSCQLGGSAPLTIRLDEPIGNRKVIRDIPTYPTYETGSWELAEPFLPTSRTAVVLVGERGCEGVSPGADVRYEVVPSSRALMLHVQVKPGPELDWICGGPDAAYRLTVDLGEPIGDRRLAHSDLELGRWSDHAVKARPSQ